MVIDKRFNCSIHISENDIDDLGHVNNTVYLKWVQEVASHHWLLGSSKDEQFAFKWVVSRHEIDYLKPCFLKDNLTAETWVEEMGGVKSIRRVEFKKENTIVAKSRTTWIMIESKTGRPKRIPKEMAQRFL